jgi:hypothetical protein
MFENNELNIMSKINQLQNKITTFAFYRINFHLPTILVLFNLPQK